MSERIKVLKTYKIFIDGKFPRTESGRYYQLKSKDIPYANVCLSSKKDLRNAVVAARKAFQPWSKKTAYNRGQILYRIAEMLESRKTQFLDELLVQGVSKKDASKELDQSIDRIIYFAGWADKINQVFGAVNPVATSHFNFTLLEPMGIVGLLSSDESPLLGLISSIIPVIVSGNSCVVIASEKYPLSSISFAEVISNSDVPSGVVNILTGTKKELATPMSLHMDINALGIFSHNMDKQLLINATENLKRISSHNDVQIQSNDFESPYIIKKFMEAKTTWHPVEFDFTKSRNY
jgi:acyl-CoA reductase-like NAD-dependent aldehyde dehydrogenase